MKTADLPIERFPETFQNGCPRIHVGGRTCFSAWLDCHISDRSHSLIWNVYDQNEPLQWDEDCRNRILRSDANDCCLAQS